MTNYVWGECSACGNKRLVKLKGKFLRCCDECIRAMRGEA